MTGLMRAVHEAVVTVDRAQRIVLFNRAAEQLFGCASDAARGSPVDRFIPGGLPGTARAPASGTLEAMHELTGLHADGRAMGLEVSFGALDAADGPRTVIVCRDVTAQREARERERSLLLRRNTELARKAHTDALTGLLNREALELHLSDTLAGAQGRGDPVSVLFLDLDGFKAVNDRHGHFMGDELLRQAAERLRDAVRRQDEVFRIGGDEFVMVLAGDVEPGKAEALAQRILAAVRRPYGLGGATVNLTVSVGIAHYPDNGSDGRSLLLAADAAMYRAKQSGKNGYHVGVPSASIVRERPPLMRELERALADDELVLHYQPIVSALAPGALGAEALVRWQHPTRGLLSPAAFVPQAESHGMCDALGHWVLQRALKMLSGSAAGAPAWVTVNLAADQLLNPRLPEQLEQLLGAAGVSAARLGVELTESMAMRDVATSHAVLQGIRDVGVCVCLDDFGTGYSSLSQLHRMPVDKLKVDRSFVEHLPADANALCIVEAIIALARVLGLPLVAEGVETLEQARTLRVLGVGEFQGFGIARPMPWDELLAFSTAWRSRPRLEDWIRPAAAERHPVPAQALRC
nr:EAL domain-containing protein [Aquabacterium terrae]